MNFLANQLLARVEPSAPAGQTTLISDVVDMLGFDGVTFVAMLGDVTSGSTLTLQAQQGDEADGSDATDVPTAAASFVADISDADNGLLAVEVFRPTKRYLRTTLSRESQNAVVDGILAVRSQSNEAPVLQAPSVIATSFALSPD
ncbi:MAG: hypothetical protein AAGF72_05585 [Pseudomonadota bacterium]